ncbi:hypothetical protein KFL_017020020 [Klebsormidium nitens]|uniref:Retroviral polymerase SH3-like domain-containing protein n=1 Tax=Klebsormidium nitens TaxID=105231 RepID=A0A1Y1IXW4_KLENI|nr:hypothetical protein KFL_017020020 [Klebsormidium nitens]|eukprot:GAQ93607.1 hypothetical protein KFL_017020020 [Klebsormidium nitens]
MRAGARGPSAMIAGSLVTLPGSEKTAPCTAEQDGSAEPLNQDLEEKTRAMLEDSGLAKELVFEARAFRHVPKQRRRKLDPVSERCVFVGYEPDSKTYRLLRDRDGNLITSRDAIIDEGSDGLSSSAPTPRTVPRRRRVTAHKFTRWPMRGPKVESLREGDAAAARAFTNGPN